MNNFPRHFLKDDKWEYPSEKPSIRIDDWPMVKASLLGWQHLLWAWQNIANLSRNNLVMLHTWYTNLKGTFCSDKWFDRRRSWEPYYLHPLAVALILIIEHNVKSIDLLLASLHHDDLEDKKSARWNTNHPLIERFPRWQIIQITDLDVFKSMYWINTAKIIEALTKPDYPKPKDFMTSLDIKQFTFSYYKRILTLYPGLASQCAKWKAWDIIQNNRTEDTSDPEKLSNKIIERYQFGLPMARFAWDTFYESLHSELKEILDCVPWSRKWELWEIKLV